jgi:hypothetical protein
MCDIGINRCYLYGIGNRPLYHHHRAYAAFSNAHRPPSAAYVIEKVGLIQIIV